MNITLGSDPELHLKDNELGRIVSSIHVLKRDKNNPIIIGKDVRLYHDNVLAEIAHPPVGSSEEAVSLWRGIFTSVREHLGSRYDLVAQASHIYDADQLQDKAARETGCNPNFDAYAEAVNPKVDFTDGLRTGSFHIHVGHPKLETMYQKADAIKLLDIYLGCASIIFDKDPTAQMRRKYYGKAGEFRHTSYGAEYRVLGNYALSSPELTKLVFDIAAYALTHVTHGTVKDVLKLANPFDVQKAINTNQPRLAEEIMDKAGMPHALLQRVKQRYEIHSIWKAWGLN